MSYTSSEYNPLFLTSGSNNVSDKVTNTNNVRIIEPNPIGEIVPHEDLFIYVSLKAKQKSKSILTEKENKTGVDVSNDFKNTINLVVPQQTIPGETLFKSKPALSTDWTEIGGWKSVNDTLYRDFEGFGITNVDIEIKSQTSPKVVIDFVDIRGATLFEQGSCSPYGLFFNLPYPVFELTVKGYYGKAVNYYLNLVKFNSKFNSETGNMECRAEFIGYTFAFLSDVIVSFVQASQNLKEENYGPQKKLREKYLKTKNFYLTNGVKPSPSFPDDKTESPWCDNNVTGEGRCTTIMDLLKSLKTFDETERAKIADSTEYQELLDLNQLEENYKNYISTITDLIRDLQADTKGFTIETTGVPEGDAKGTKTLFKFKDEASLQVMLKSGGILHNYFNKEDGKLLNNINEILIKKIGESSVYDVTGISCLLQDPKINEENKKLYDANILNKTDGGKPWFIKVLNNIKQEFNLGYESIKDEKIYVDDYGTEVVGVLDLGYILNDAYNELSILNDPEKGIITQKKIKLIEASNNIIEDRIGFKPTIRNIFTVLLCNTDAFMDILLGVAYEAEKYHNEIEDLTNSQEKKSGQLISGRDKIYPWPTYLEYKFSPKKGTQSKQGTKEVYPGQRYPSWPEVIFVEDFLKAFLKLKEDIDILNEDLDDKPGYDNFVPINPLESPYWEEGTATPIKYLNETGLNDRYLTIGERMFLTLDHSYFQPIRLTSDALLVPKIGVGNWNPLKPKFIEELGKIDAWNLLYTLDNENDIRGTINENLNTFKNSIKEILKKKENGTWLEIPGKDLLKIPVDDAKKIGLNVEEIYYVFKSDEKGVNIKKKSLDDTWVHPNPFKNTTSTADTKKLIFKILSPDELLTLENKRNITVNSETSAGNSFLKAIDSYKIAVKEGIKDLNFSTSEFNLGNDVWPKDLVNWDVNQNIFSFDKPQLYTTLAMSFQTNYSDKAVNSWWLKGDLANLDLGGDIESNMGVISYWDDDDGNHVDLMSFTSLDGTPLIIPTQKEQNIYNDSFYKELNTNSKNFKGSVIGLESVTAGESEGVKCNPALDPKFGNFAVATATLVTTPLWLDNVRKFRKDTATDETLGEDDQYKNLAYLFLATLKTTPLITRIIDTDGYLYNKKTNEDQPQASVIWSLRAFNSVAGIAKVPKAWLLALGSQLWRFGRYKNDPNKKSKSNEGWSEWGQLLTCENCSASTYKPQGKDPLIQPGWDSITNVTTQQDSWWTSGQKFRNNKQTYLSTIYGSNNNNIWVGEYKSVFSSNQRNVGDKDGIQKINGGDDLVSFHYFNWYYNKIGKLGEYVIPYTANTDGNDIRENYAWPQVYIAPHHIPYVSPEIFDDTTNGRGSDFVLITNNWIGYQDYVTMMPTTFIKNPYNEAFGLADNESDLYKEETVRSIEEDGNLGFIMQNIPDNVKNIIVEEFERWSLSEWKDIIKIVDPVNFNSGNLTDTYAYFNGKKSPAIVSNTEGGDDKATRLLALRQNSELKKLLTDKYGILNSTPKIWYGYDDNTTTNSKTQLQAGFHNESNYFYDKGFIVSESQFNTYLNSFHDEYIKNKNKRLSDVSEKKKSQGNNGLTGTIIDDEDIKLGLYRTFKSINDKWISASYKGKLFFNLIGAAEGSRCVSGGAGPKITLASHFQYINRVMGDIGDIAVIDITKLNELRDNLKITLYQYLSDLLTDNDYLFFPLPTYINFGNQGVTDEDLKDMFRPSLLDIKDISCGPLFLCMYVGGYSRQLKLKPSANCPFDRDALNNIEDDGFSFSDVANRPDEIVSPTEYQSDGYTAFRVLYGLENQNHFKNIQLDQSEFSETAESLLVIDRLSQQGGNDKTTKGQNLNTVYLTRSYTCQIESLGNMMIQPMTYFDLQGVPMFSGAYLITEVRHNFRPNHATTNFKGSRQPRATVPLVTDVAIAMNLSLKGTGKSSGSITKIKGAGGKTAKVYSAYDGIVVQSGPARGFGAPPNGGWVIVRYGLNNGDAPFSDGNYYFYVYGHVNPIVKPNQIVRKGEELGTAVYPNINTDGTKTGSDGLHLHLQVHQSTNNNFNFLFCKNPQDPKKFDRDCPGKISPIPFLNLGQDKSIQGIQEPSENVKKSPRGYDLYPPLDFPELKDFANPVSSVNKPKVTSSIIRNDGTAYHGAIDIGFNAPEILSVDVSNSLDYISTGEVISEEPYEK